MRPRRHRFAAPLAWAIIVGLASVTPPGVLGFPTSASSGVPFDLLFHFAGYAVLAFLLVRAELALPLTLIAASVFGIGVEAVQFLLPFRNATLLDAAVNLGGAIVGGLLATGSNSHASTTVFDTGR